MARARRRTPSRPAPIEVLERVPSARREAPACRRLLGALRRHARRDAWGVELLLGGDREIRALNRRMRGRDRTTDVLSFPAGGDMEPGRPHLGEIAISMPQARRQARAAGWPLPHEMALLVTHGFLHLLGYDHESDDGTMRRLEARLLRRVAGVALDARGLPWGEAPGPRAPQGRRKGMRHA